MPPLKRPSNPEHCVLPERKALVAAETDVLVVGGGPAGIGAAIGAAASGARVILAERYGFLGGSATAALVTIFMSYYTEHPHREHTGEASLYPTDHGTGKPVIGGILAKLVERLVETGGAIPPTLHSGYIVPFDPEIFKMVTMELLDEAGVGVLLHAFASGVTGPVNEVEGVVFETKSGPLVIRAKNVVDCTGDGDIAAWSGTPYEVGRREDGLVQPVTLMFRMAEFAQQAFSSYVRKHPQQWRGVHGLWDLVESAARAGELSLPREDILFFASPREREVIVNSTRVNRILGTNVWDLTYAEHEGRRQMRQIVSFFRKYVPGFEKAYIAQSGAHVGIRETRRILGEYQLKKEDVLKARKFHDTIARGTYPIDIHNPKGKGTKLERLPAGTSYDIPLRCLIPRKTANLVLAGRCISGTHEAHASYRIMPICMATGQAAGVCAALSVKQGRQPRDVAAEDVRNVLNQQQANL